MTGPTPSSTGKPSSEPSYTVVEIDSIYTDAEGAVKISTMISTVPSAGAGAASGPGTREGVATGSVTGSAATTLGEEGAQETGSSQDNDNALDGDGNEYSSTTQRKEGDDTSATATITIRSSSSSAGGAVFAAMRTMDAIALGAVGIAAVRLL